jgi:hypothetical protein
MTISVSDRLFEKLCRVGSRLGFNFRSVGTGDFVGNTKDVPPDERTATLMHRAFYENTGTIVDKINQTFAMTDSDVS